MKTIHWILLIVAIVVANNFLMLTWIERKHVVVSGRNEVDVSTVSSDKNGEFQEVVIAPMQGDPVGEPPTSVEQFPANDVAAQSQDKDFIATLQRVSNSSEFVDVLDAYQLETQRRYMEVEKRQRRMSVNELYDIVKNSKSLFEKQSAVQNLVQGKLGGLEAYQLKELYQGEGVHLWSKTRILAALLDKGDIDGLVWAKELIADGQAELYLDDKMIRGVYKKDKDFIINYLDDIDVENVNVLSSVSSLFYDEPELATAFYEKNFDKILASESDYTFQFGVYDVKFEMTRAQQSKLVDFFGGTNSRKRNYAIGMIGNITDINILRDGYNMLERDKDKQNFLMRLLGDGQNNSDKTALIRELASASDNPKIRSFADRIK